MDMEMYSTWLLWPLHPNISQIDGETATLTSFVLVLARVNMHQKVDDILNRGVNILEQDEANQNGFGREAERLVKGSVANEKGEKPEQRQKMKLGDNQDLESVVHWPVAKFMGCSKQQHLDSVPHSVSRYTMSCINTR